jgi:desulfoferrodoxin (superoxide reductase-like protein)
MANNIQIPRCAVSTALCLLFGFGVTGAYAAEEQAEQFTPEFRQCTRPTMQNTRRRSSLPTAKRGEWFNVTVSVGAGGQHPSLSEHAVRYIALYKDTVEIARVYLHPVYSLPTVTFTVALDEGGSLRAVEEPTHSAAWEASKKISVVP